MRKRIAYLLSAFAIVGALAAAPQVASAVDFFGGACQGAGANSAACSGGGDTITGTNGIILRAAALISILASVAAVIGLMIAGIMFITANGDSSKLSNAKQMIIYIVVGLLVIFAARAIVVFIINNVK